MLFHLFISALGLIALTLLWLHPLGADVALREPVSLGLIAWSCWEWFCGLWVRQEEKKRQPKPILHMGGFSWNMNDFCRGWLITGETGSGKTLSVINNMLWQVSQNCPNWGGVCIDDKGLYWETLSVMFKHLGREKDLILLKVRPDDAPDDWTPPQTFNLLGDERFPYSAMAKDVCDVAASLGQGGDQPFFKTQAEMQMDFAFHALACAGATVSLSNAYDLLASQASMDRIIKRLRDAETDEARALISHYETQIANQPPEQLGGVRGTLANRLKNFTPPDIADVFSPMQSTFSMSQIDDGKVVCVSVPQRFKTERRYIHTLLKLLFYSHVLLRFDQCAEKRAQHNLLILWADEAQKIITASADGTSDYNVVDVIREAKATVVAATQSYTSLIPPIGDEKKAKVFIANMANRVVCKAADEESARIAADTVGKRKKLKRSYGYSGGRTSTNYSEEDRYYIEPYEFRKLRKFQAIIQHCEHGFRRANLKPLGADGRVPDWYRG